MSKDFDIVVYGASGFTGRLVAEYLAGLDESARWAMAGRNADKLAAVRDEIGAPADTPLVVADADKPETIADMVARTKVVITTVGPYQLYGEALVKACAEAGTDYVDLCGEPAWMRQMIDAYSETAKASGARIVFSCGFDSVPFDLGVWYLQQQAQEKQGSPCSVVHGRVRAMKGTFSGGTAASLQATMAAAAKDPVILEYLKSPFSLAPGFEGPEQPRGNRPYEDEITQGWLAPFIMAPINTKNVHRSNMLMGHAYGADFCYDEMLMTGPGEKGKQIATMVATDKSMEGDKAPKPGEGPSKEEREAGFYDVLFLGKLDDGSYMVANIKGDKDPGYGSTSKMISQCALCLLDDTAPAGGIWTPAAAFGGTLITRLEAAAGLSFTLER